MQLIMEKWDEILNKVKEEQELTDIYFDTWLKPLKLYGVENNKLYIIVPSDHMSGIGYIYKK